MKMVAVVYPQGKYEQSPAPCQSVDWMLKQSISVSILEQFTIVQSLKAMFLQEAGRRPERF